MFKKMLILECLGVILQSQLRCPSWIFDTSLFRKMFELLTCKIITFESRALCRDQFEIDSHGFWVFKFFSLAFEEKSSYKVGCHVENVFYLKDFVTWCLCQGRMRFFIVTVF
jgi:hypothetical protein